MAARIMCGVDNCDYWQDMNCTADRIKVNSQNNGSADCSAETTFCETFKTDRC